GGYGFPQQPPGAPQGGYGFPQQPPQAGYGYPQQPGQYGQGPGMYPTAPIGAYPGGPGGPGGSGGNGKIIAIIAAAVAVVLVIGTVGFFLINDDGGSENEADGDKKSTSNGSGGGGKPASADGKELFKIESPKLDGEDSKYALGAWATDDIFAKGTIDSIVGLDAGSGDEKWNLPLDGEICAATKHLTEAGKTAVITQETKSSKAACNQLAVIDVNSGKKEWQETMPAADGASTLGINLTIAKDVVAAKWIGGSVAYKMSGGSPLWRSKGSNECRDDGFAGGKELMAVVECGDYSDPKIKVQKLNPKTGKSTWEFEAPDGVESARVISTDPVILAVGAGTSLATDVMTVGDDGKLKSKISLGDRKYDPGCGTDTESCVSAVADKKYVYMPSGQHQGETTSTNEILAFDLETGQPKWKSDAGESRTIVPVRMDGSKLIAYKKPTYDSGGEVVAIDPAAKGKQEVYLRNPDDSSRVESDLGSISLRDGPLYVNGRLFLQRSLVSKSSDDAGSTYGKYIGIGFGAE
ncbi:PQQ-binding-like beta-propeller repeat protein, partial [Streptomyces albidus (ex Kaewkla and Franco 2022)]|uniref:outer membrane protein assembly factor BamB family protein n=1 Tax=Streptomyces albidus (ex Kaewkla and Franco 2022) TaxID=722709 RepID=UPI0015EFD6C4